VNGYAAFKHSPERAMETLEISPDGSTMITGEEVTVSPVGSKAAVSIWDTKTGRVRALPDDFDFFWRFSPDSRWFTTTTHGSDGFATSIRIIDASTLNARLTIPVVEKGTRLTVEAVTPDGKVMFGNLLKVKSRHDYQSTLKFWDTASGKELASIAADPQGHYLAYIAAFSPDGQTAAVPYGVRDGDGWKKAALVLFECGTGKRLKSIDFGDQQSVGPAAFSADGRWIALPVRSLPGGRIENGTALDYPQPRIHLIEATTGRIRETLVSPQAMSVWARFSPDGKTLATTGYGEVLLWDLSRPPGTPPAR
jgi:WD40 repeat protein